jgi:periplasmic protein CpxP/Spy
MAGTARHSLKHAARALVFATPLISLAVAAGPVIAQTAPAPTVSTPLPEGFADAVEIRIAELHRALHIVPPQEALFKAYADVMRDNAQAIHVLFAQRAQLGEFSAPAELRWYGQLTAAHAEAVNKLIAPLDALYQSLSPDQKLAADRHFEQLRQHGTARRGS